MNFQEALHVLKHGKYVSRPGMIETGEFLVLFPDMPFVWKIVPMPNPNAGVWFGKVEDLDANDWVVYEGKASLPVVEEVKDDQTVQ